MRQDMIDHQRPVANPVVVLREEFDDWAILFDPDTGSTVGLNPTAVIIWKLLDGRHTEEDILRELEEVTEGVPTDGGEHVREFIEALSSRGLVGHESQEGRG